MRVVQVATAGFDVARAAGVLPERDARAAARTLLRPGWPLALLFYGFPLWWALGLAHFIFFIVAVPMAIELMRRSPVRVPRWFGLWLVFLAWVLLGLVTLWTHAPGTTYSAGLGKLIGFGLNYLWYLSSTVVLLYIYNLRERELSTVRVQRMVGFLFIVVALFGLAGTLAPSFEFKSLMEYVMPAGISHADFIHAMIHPQLASASDLLGYEQPRPIAPFMYANAWGNNLALCAPMFVAAWFGAHGARWRAIVGVGIVLVATIPIIHSLNRGMWLGLALALVFAVVRFAIAGHTKPLNLLVVGLVVGTIGFLASPLYTTVTERFAHPHSNERRGNLAGESVSTALTSPVIGYGGTRAKQGSYASIAGADSARCSSCGAPSLGTQGFLWLLLLGTGYVGAALCLMFLLSQFLSAIRRVDTTSMVASVSILMSLLFFFIYDSLGSALFILMIAIALNARAADQPVAGAARRRGRSRPRRGRDLGDHMLFVRRNAALIGTLSLLGGLVGGAVAMASPTSYAARTTVLMARAPVYVDTVGDHAPPAVTVDTDAALFTAPIVNRRVSARTGVPEDDVQSRLLISAEPLTRVLTVTFQGATPKIARAGSEAAVHAMLQERSDVMVAHNLTRLNAIRRSLAKLQTAAIRLQLHGKGSDTFAQDLAGRIQVLQSVSSQLQELSRSSGQVMDSASVVRTEKARPPTKWAGSGVGIGLLCALTLAWFRPRGGWFPRLRWRRAIPRVWDVWTRRAG